MADGSVAITAGAGTPIRVLTGMGANSADQQVVTLADQNGNLLPSTVITTSLSALNAVADGSTFVDGFNRVVVTVTGTFVGTLTFQASYDGGTTWTVRSLANSASPAATASTATSPSTWMQSLEAPLFRVQMTAYTSGTATVRVAYSTVVPDYRTVILASGNNSVGSIAQVTGSVNPGSGAANLGKQYGFTPSGTDVGVAVYAQRAPSVPTSLGGGTGNYSRILVDAEGKVIIQQYADPSLTWQSSITLTTTTATAMNAAQAAGIRNYCTGLTISNSSATTTLVQILDGATVIWQAQMAAAANVYVPFETPLRGTAATALNAKLGTAVTSVYVSAQGFIGI